MTPLALVVGGIDGPESIPLHIDNTGGWAAHHLGCTVHLTITPTGTTTPAKAQWVEQ